jgi:hypothetical protein
MSTPAPQVGYQWSITVNDGTSNAQQAFSTPRKVEVPAYDIASIKTTNLQTANNTHTYIPGSKEPGMVKFEIEYSSADYARLAALTTYSSGTTLPVWIVTAPPGTTGSAQYTFSGFVTKYPVSVDGNDDLVIIKTEVKVSGVITVGTAA